MQATRLHNIDRIAYIRNAERAAQSIRRDDRQRRRLAEYNEHNAIFDDNFNQIQPTPATVNNTDTSRTTNANTAQAPNTEVQDTSTDETMPQAQNLPDPARVYPDPSPAPAYGHSPALMRSLRQSLDQFNLNIERSFNREQRRPEHQYSTEQLPPTQSTTGPRPRRTRQQGNRPDLGPDRASNRAPNERGFEGLQSEDQDAIYDARNRLNEQRRQERLRTTAAERSLRRENEQFDQRRQRAEAHIAQIIRAATDGRLNNTEPMPQLTADSSNDSRPPTPPLNAGTM